MQPSGWVGILTAEGRAGCRILGSLPFPGPRTFLSMGFAMARWKFWRSSTNPANGQGTRTGIPSAGTGVPKRLEPAAGPGSGSAGGVRRIRPRPQPDLRSNSPVTAPSRSRTWSRSSRPHRAMHRDRVRPSRSERHRVRCRCREVHSPSIPYGIGLNGKTMGQIKAHSKARTSVMGKPTRGKSRNLYPPGP